MKVTRLFKDFFESEIVGENGFNRCMTKTEIRAAGNIKRSRRNAP